MDGMVQENFVGMGSKYRRRFTRCYRSQNSLLVRLLDRKQLNIRYLGFGETGKRISFDADTRLSNCALKLQLNIGSAIKMPASMFRSCAHSVKFAELMNVFSSSAMTHFA